MDRQLHTDCLDCGDNKIFGPVQIVKFGNKIGSIKTIEIPCTSSESKANTRKKMGAAIRTGERMLVPKNHAGKMNRVYKVSMKVKRKTKHSKT